ncbi:MAG: hypothetical protein ACR2MD_15445, partial [Aridibacter sp.]
MSLATSLGWLNGPVRVTGLRWSSFSGHKTLYLFLHVLLSNLTHIPSDFDNLDSNAIGLDC